MNLAYLGKGMSFPLRTNQDTGDLKGVEERENIKASLRMFFSTVIGERVLNGAYGMPRVMFEPYEQGTADVLRDAAIRGITRFEQRIRLLEVNVVSGPFTEDGRASARVITRYIIRALDSEDNFTYIPEPQEFL